MTDSTKSGFFKSLFGGRKADVRDVIPLHIPLTLQVGKETEQNIEAMWNQVLQQRLGPLLLLQATNRYLEKVNPLPLSNEQRARISNMVLNEVVVAVGSLFSRFFQQGGGIPETREQRETISLAMRAIEQLAINYRRFEGTARCLCNCSGLYKTRFNVYRYRVRSILYDKRW